MSPTEARKRHVLAASVAMTAFAATAHAQDEPAGTSYLAVRQPAAVPRGQRALGHGSHAYQFVVRDPQAIDKPLRRGSYRIIAPDPFDLGNGTGVYDGVTDALGRTAVFRFEETVDVTDWRVQPVVGHGGNSQSFSLRTPDGDPAEDVPYLIDVQGKSVYCGHSLPDGSSVIVRDPTALDVSLFTGISPRECRALKRRLDAVVRLRGFQARLRALDGLHRRYRHSDDIDGLLAQKREALVLGAGDATALRSLARRKLADAHGPEERAEVLNGLGYSLAGLHSMRHAEIARGWLEESVTLHPDWNNLDSLGWLEHRLGEDAAALPLLDRGIEDFLKTCPADHAGEFAIGLGHRGAVLWSLGRRIEAIDMWATADSLTQDGSWTVGSPDIQVIAHVRAGDLAAEGFPYPDCVAKLHRAAGLLNAGAAESAAQEADPPPSAPDAADPQTD